MPFIQKKDNEYDGFTKWAMDLSCRLSILANCLSSKGFSRDEAMYMTSVITKSVIEDFDQEEESADEDPDFSGPDAA
jgi:hypothetical protein